MGDLAGRPLTVVTPAMLDACEAVRGVIVARWSRCGRYVTLQASTATDPRTELDVCAGRAIIVADAEDVHTLRQLGDARAGEVIRASAHERLTDARASV